MSTPEQPPFRPCDGCGKRVPGTVPVNVRVPGRATQFKTGTFFWCGQCRKEQNGKWKHHYVR